MANIKSAKKRIKVTLVRTERNKAIRSKVKTAIKKVESAVAASDKQLAQANLKNAVVEITASLKDGYLTISAKHEESDDKKDENDKYIRRERRFGSCQRSFFV